MKTKSSCCEKFSRKGKPCKSCPLLAGLGKKKLKSKKKLRKALRKKKWAQAA